MKRLALTLIVLLTAASLYAGGKECNIKKSSKNVELTGTIVRTGSGDAAKTVFRVANDNRSYTVCDDTNAAVLERTSDAGATYRVKGKVINCGNGEELLIESAKKV